MQTAKLFENGGSQAVRLPKEFRFEGSEVVIERRGTEVVLKPSVLPALKTLNEVVLKPSVLPALKTLNEIARYMGENFPQGADFPDIERLAGQ